MNSLSPLQKFSDALPNHGKKMPMLFVGHGSPMNGIEDNEFSRRWKAMGKELPRPEAVLCISAHWFTRGTFVTAMEQPKTIHDFYGFPEELNAVQYPAPGNPMLAEETSRLLTKAETTLDHEWGLDHGCWSVVKQMYPDADIPVLQLSIDGTKNSAWHYELASQLFPLRKKGVLIIGSGNIVHNLRILNWKNPDTEYDWAAEMDKLMKKYISESEDNKLIRYHDLGTASSLAVPTPEHYLPLLYVLGLKDRNEEIEFFNEKIVMGSVSMTSLKVL